MMPNKTKYSLRLITVVGSIVMLSNVFSITSGYYIGKKIEDRKYSASTRNHQLIMIEESDYLINQQLIKLIAEIPDAASARVSLIQTSAAYMGKEQIPLLRFDMTHAAVPGSVLMPVMLSNVPLSQWNDYLANMIAGKCSSVVVDDMVEPSAKIRLKNQNLHTFVACPLQDRRGELLGGVFMSWENPPMPQSVQKAIILLQISAIKIVNYLEVRIDERIK